MPEMTDGDSRADSVYRWTVRWLYVVLIGGELVYLWSVWKDTPAGVELRAKVAARAKKLKECEPCAKRRQFLKDRAHMLWQAHEAVEEAAASEE